MKKMISLVLVLTLLWALTACNRSDDTPNTDTQHTENTATELKKATQSAVLQEARNKYTEAYAEDVSDGVVDGMKNGTPVSDPNYGVSGDTPTYTYVGNGYTAVLNQGAFWSLTEN